MSGFPTRLGRALRLFTPVVLASALALPLIAPAKDHGKGEKKDPAAVQAPVNTIAAPAAAPAQSADNSTSANDAAEQQGADTGNPAETTQSSASQSEPNDAAEQQGTDNGNSSESANASEDTPGQDNASADVSGNDDSQHSAGSESESHGQGNDDAQGDDHGQDKGDDHGKSDDHGKGDHKGKDKSDKDKKDKSDKDHGKGHDKGDDHGKGHDKGDDHGKGHDKGDKDHGKGDDHGKGHGKGDRGPAGPAAVPSSLAPIVQQMTSTPRVCTSRRALGIRLDRGYRVRAASVMFNGKLVRIHYGHHGRNVNATINLRGMKAGTYTVRTVVVTKGGRIRVGTRRYRTCSAKMLPVRKPVRHPHK